jgi:hypothetical protein
LQYFPTKLNYIPSGIADISFCKVYRVEGIECDEERTIRAMMQQVTVAVFYRHACNDAAAAACAQNWDEWARLLHIARSIERAYPAVTAKARFAMAEDSIV